jgi:hypothetical protein
VLTLTCVSLTLDQTTVNQERGLREGKAEGKQLGRPKIAERTERAVRAVRQKKDLDCARLLQLLEWAWARCSGSAAS